MNLIEQAEYFLNENSTEDAKKTLNSIIGFYSQNVFSFFADTQTMQKRKLIM